MLTPFVKALATWRITELITTDEITRPAREAVTKRWPGSRAAYLVTCSRCVSVWSAAVVLLLPEWACTLLGLSGATMLAYEVSDHASQRALTARMAAAHGVRAGETN